MFETKVSDPLQSSACLKSPTAIRIPRQMSPPWQSRIEKRSHSQDKRAPAVLQACLAWEGVSLSSHQHWCPRGGGRSAPRLGYSVLTTAWDERGGSFKCC